MFTYSLSPEQSLYSPNHDAKNGKSEYPVLDPGPCEVKNGHVLVCQRVGDWLGND